MLLQNPAILITQYLRTRQTVCREMSKAEVSQSDGDVGFTLNFSLDVVEDIYAEVEEVMRLSGHGRFREARKLSNDTLAKHTDIFAVLAEDLRSLLDQGDNHGVLLLVGKGQREDDARKTVSSRFSKIQREILNLFSQVATACAGYMEIEDGPLPFEMRSRTWYLEHLTEEQVCKLFV